MATLTRANQNYRKPQALTDYVACTSVVEHIRKLYPRVAATYVGISDEQRMTVLSPTIVSEFRGMGQPER